MKKTEESKPKPSTVPAAKPADLLALASSAIEEANRLKEENASIKEKLKEKEKQIDAQEQYLKEKLTAHEEKESSYILRLSDVERREAKIKDFDMATTKLNEGIKKLKEADAKLAKAEAIMADIAHKEIELSNREAKATVKREEIKAEILAKLTSKFGSFV